MFCRHGSRNDMRGFGLSCFCIAINDVLLNVAEGISNPNIEPRVRSAIEFLDQFPGEKEGKLTYGFREESFGITEMHQEEIAPTIEFLRENEKTLEQVKKALPITIHKKLGQGRKKEAAIVCLNFFGGLTDVYQGMRRMGSFCGTIERREQGRQYPF